MKRTRVRYDRMVALLLSAALLVPLGKAVAGAGPRSEARRTTYTVRAGDTLWGIAQRFGQGDDPRGYVFELGRTNRLAAGDIQPGQVLTLP